MRYESEAEIKQALGIESWRNLSKDKMVRFAAMMPDMDTEVALKIVEQFPVFKDFATGMVDVLKEAHESTLSANKQSQENFHRSLEHVREILNSQLDKGEPSWEERKFIIEQIMDTLRMEGEKDSENKKFLFGALKMVAAGAGAALALGVAFVGGKIMLESKEDPDDSMEE
ncbi:hypothetical protein HUT15_04870 [Streptomyces sp. NA03103]|uniref:hypothetical protein n=1 Tax=Streptomyces sp. NA03103 TaxID=2742134 RepID=UPI001590F531|nr:hypothetical protein [Streptomyces sp. NA03103]QKW59899.1 hypothetical protein HUT15_04870 [Streptomyces sp. NA03103]